jgi:hypothetical protein
MDYVIHSGWFMDRKQRLPSEQWQWQPRMACVKQQQQWRRRQRRAAVSKGGAGRSNVGSWQHLLQRLRRELC